MKKKIRFSLKNSNSRNSDKTSTEVQYCLDRIEYVCIFYLLMHLCFFYTQKYISRPLRNSHLYWQFYKRVEKLNNTRIRIVFSIKVVLLHY